MSSLTAQSNAHRIRDISKELGLSRTSTVDMLLDFYELKKLDLLIRQIKVLYREGFSPDQLSQMTVLLTQLSVILQDRI